MKILICGFMGSGKTTLSKKWEEEASLHNEDSNWRFLDLDQFIYQKYQDKSNNEKELSDIILRLGWDKFREVEAEELNSLLEDDGELVISLGGGSLENEEIRKGILTNQDIKIVFLDTPFEQCWNRVSKEEGRPLVKKGKGFLKELYNSRIPNYRQAHLTLKPSESGISFSQLIIKLN